MLPTEVPITVADSSGALAGDGRGPILVSLDPPDAGFRPRTRPTPRADCSWTSWGRRTLPRSSWVDAAGNRQINPQLQAKGITVIRDTHGKTSHLTADDIEALSMYLKSLQ